MDLDLLIEKFKRARFGEKYEEVMKKLELMPDPSWSDNVSKKEKELIKESNDAEYDALIYYTLKELEKDPKNNYKLKLVLEDLYLAKRINKQ